MTSIEEFIKSGILELYCLGALNEKDEALVQTMLQHTLVQEELRRIEETMEMAAMQAAVQPPAQVKRGVQAAIYKSSSGQGKPHAPFIEKGVGFDEIYAWAKEQTAQVPLAAEEVIKLTDLPSTSLVTNFFALVKQGHPEEWHDDFLEYIVVLEGACTMDFAGNAVSYKKGDIIEIPLHVKHTATITSTEPMWALVQRQMI